MVNSCMIHNRSVRLAFDASFLVIFVNIYLSSVAFIHQYSHPQFSKHCSAVHLCFFFQYGIYSFPASIALTTSVLRIFLNQHSKCVLLQIYFCALIEGGKNPSLKQMRRTESSRRDYKDRMRINEVCRLTMHFLFFFFFPLPQSYGRCTGNDSLMTRGN